MLTFGGGDACRFSAGAIRLQGAIGCLGTLVTAVGRVFTGYRGFPLALVCFCLARMRGLVALAVGFVAVRPAARSLASRAASGFDGVDALAKRLSVGGEIKHWIGLGGVGSDLSRAPLIPWM